MFLKAKTVHTDVRLSHKYLINIRKQSSKFIDSPVFKQFLHL